MKDGKIIVHTAGTFDLFHIGHLNILKRSKELGDVLVVAVSTDELVESYKDYKPYIPFEQRFEIIKSIKYVDITIKQEKLHDINQLIEYGVDITTIGSDWENKYLEGIEWMRNNGKKVVYLPYTQGISSTIIKDWIYKREKEHGALR